MWSAWSKVAAGSPRPGTDGISTDRFARCLDDNLRELAVLLASGQYRPQPLLGLEIVRGTKARHLAIPTVRDRVAQRAFLQAVGGMLESKAAEASFAYRKGRSWLDALRAVERHRDSGLRVVCRGDIRTFFDAIDHGLLREALVPALGEDDAVELALAWPDFRSS